jgi:hypothetical protein
MDDNKIEIEQNVNQEQEQQQEQAQPINPLPEPTEPAEQEQAQPGQEQEQGDETEHAKPADAQGQDTGLPSDSEPTTDVPTDPYEQPVETEVPTEITFAISPELVAKFQERADEGEALESLQRAFINEMVKRVSASRAESRKIWEEVYAAAGRSGDEHTGTLDPATNVVTFTPVETVEEGKPGFGTLLKKLFAA